MSNLNQSATEEDKVISEKTMLRLMNHCKAEINNEVGKIKKIIPSTATSENKLATMADVSGGGGSYTLPAASSSTLGGIKVGQNLTIDPDGTLNAQASGGGGGSGIHFSTDEIEVGTDYDGAKLYSKTFLINERITNSYSVGIIDGTVIDYSGYVENTNGDNLSINYKGDSTVWARQNRTTGNVYFETNYDNQGGRLNVLYRKNG